MVRIRVPAVKDNSMRAGIEEDLDHGVFLPSSESQNCANVGNGSEAKKKAGEASHRMHGPPRPVSLAAKRWKSNYESYELG